MALDLKLENYIAQSLPMLHQLIRDLCAIPAPSHHEEKRAAFCKRWFDENGCSDAFIDDAMNVICPYNVAENNDLIVFMAHTDTVFSDTNPLPFDERDGRMYCPGVTDDTASLAVLMICAQYMLQNRSPSKCGGLLWQIPVKRVWAT